MKTTIETYTHLAISFLRRNGQWLAAAFFMTALPAYGQPGDSPAAGGAARGAERSGQKVKKGEGTDDARFAKLVDDFLVEYAAIAPSQATTLGLHEHDGELEDLSPAGRDHQLAFIKRWEGRLAAVPAERLSPDNRFDLELFRYALGQQRFSLTEMADYRRLPGLYLRLAANSINLLIKQSPVPVQTRLRAVLGRQAKLPALLKTAEQNLDRMAPVFIDITLSDLDATVHLFTNDVPQAFAQVSDVRLQNELKKSCTTVAAALRGFGEFLRKARPQATASFALGPELLRRRLWAEEMIDEPLDSLLRRSQAELERLRAEFAATAQKIDEKQPAAAIQLQMQKDHPTPDKIISETTARLQNQQRFLIEKQLLTLPSSSLPEVKETPPFMRATSLASMDVAGPFETTRVAYYYVTLPESSWRPEQTEDFMRGAYNRPLIDVVNIHEAFPGHFVQEMSLSRLSKARKLFGASSNIEGWAHYSEQMMLDENYGSGNLQIRLAQLQDALLRASRFVVSLRMHTQGMTVKEAADFFHQVGFQNQKVAEMEALRGTEDPMYLVYTYGKLEILRLRQELQARAKSPADFSLRRFHDQFLSYGQAPLKLIRKAMLP